ncbi:peptidoglycan-associated lipoprotein Pal [Hydrogenovibrio sp. 3SP14C1]|uniref:peptidoglycan-associated lipoprotein Pal n=1 Tax=Hydrogenovibrio sp. 3SP14C1 TaxID=3038774 RepID=UPI002416F30D|nr:peptidoglycan-associated lipoprotein Pal [Hydrogenovibrio sp. 3SP14C1]MDG4812913.1 peptidoglycan-associated lipoprotein Pal [Hydrogenovibrio sp. 3SP14C1]
MSTSGLKQLFLVGFLGLTLVGCSSTPTNEEADSGSTAEQTSGTTGTETSSATDSNAGSGDDMAAATNSAGQTAEDLYAALQGKVVNFEFDRSEVQAQFYDVVKMNADYMALNSSAMVTVKGYCDERGTREYNLALGERRANAVKNALIAEGVSPSRINVISFGEENPVDPAHNKAAWAKNRRAEFSY